MALYALAMILLGFAHKPIAISGPQPDLAAYALPNGELPVLCLHDANGGDTPGIVVDRHCDACALSHAPGLLMSSTGCVRTPSPYRLATWNDPQGQLRPAATHAPVSRGPPSENRFRA